jgi:AcrR family transcriptional regulator
MAEGTRTYSSILRADQARQTRKRIVDAAAELFAERGYSGTTIDAIAIAAGVSRKTVFDSVGGKAQLMKLAYDFAIVGDDEPVPLINRPEIKAVLAEPDHAKRLAMYASLVVSIDSRLSPAWRAFEGAATSDPEAAKLYDEMVGQRRHAMQEAAQLFADAGALRPDIDVDVAADLMWFYNDPSLYDKLVRQRGWPVSRFQAWLAEALQVQLLGISPTTESPSAELPGQKS